MSTECDDHGRADDELRDALSMMDDVLRHFQELGQLAQATRHRLAAAYPAPESATGLPTATVPDLPTSPPGDRVGLTGRQRQVLQLLVQGVSNRRIGRSLHITEQTVKAHLHMIYRKLGVTDRTEAVIVALRLALVEQCPPQASGR